MVLQSQHDPGLPTRFALSIPDALLRMHGAAIRGSQTIFARPVELISAKKKV